MRLNRRTAPGAVRRTPEDLRPVLDDQNWTAPCPAPEVALPGTLATPAPGRNGLFERLQEPLDGVDQRGDRIVTVQAPCCSAQTRQISFECYGSHVRSLTIAAARRSPFAAPFRRRRAYKAAHRTGAERQMAVETVYIIQAYVQGRGKGLKAEQQIGCKSAEEARRKAERLAPLRLGVVAFARQQALQPRCAATLKGVRLPAPPAD